MGQGAEANLGEGAGVTNNNEGIVEDNTGSNAEDDGTDSPVAEEPTDPTAGLPHSYYTFTVPCALSTDGYCGNSCDLDMCKQSYIINEIGVSENHACRCENQIVGYQSPETEEGGDE